LFVGRAALFRTERWAAEPVAAADGGRDVGFEEFLVAQRVRRD
jgi:hypothetical protein